MSNGPKIVKPAKPMTRREELVSMLTNKHAQGRAVQEWHALIELAKMDGTTVEQAFSMVRDIVDLRKVMALEAIAGELHAVNQGVANFNVLQEMLHPELFEKDEAKAAAAEAALTQSETEEDPELPDETTEQPVEAADSKQVEA